jgi:glucose/arabinose dehydrogenase
MEGISGSGPPLGDIDSKFGVDALMTAIRERHSGLDVWPSTASAMTEPVARALAIFVREGATAKELARQKWKLNEVDDGRLVQTERYLIEVRTVVEGLENPWALAVLPDGSMLVTERLGRLRLVRDGRLVPAPVEGTPAVWAKGQGGLLDVAVHPRYAENGWVYLSYSDVGTDRLSMTAVARGRLVDGLWLNHQSIFRTGIQQYRHSILHFGSRLTFDGAGHLYFSIGDRGFAQDAQDLARPNGKVHRVRDDGTIATDSPFDRGPIPSIWTYGNRNPQGLAVHPGTGEVWEVEHGPRGGDELNILQASGNYGWPVVTRGIGISGPPITSTIVGAMEDPIYEWTPSITPSALEFYTGKKFSAWHQNLLVSSLIYQDLRRLVLDGQKVVYEEVLFRGLGRVRDVAIGPDGDIYVVLNEPDRIARVSLVTDRRK